ncbi:hypothetical protein F0L74_27120 [Chitinophaga agrisoli]|uniref:Lanthionine synthetase-like protein n=1 Tax=Chitinophaga agrisoli TaxID=2607653 RepID=A0A5B2VLC0_9BACT|nr:lanthionine synthetase LanC family protein [Chitinophaga agrisoli]KAA2239861.1 hypothetical protein F0L74_27120 [Chitinophaga agrisoli]
MDSATTQLQRIYQDTVNMLRTHSYNQEHANSLFKGPWGALLFLFYYEQYTNTQADHAADLLEEIYAAYTPSATGDYSLCEGHTGPFWLLAHGSKHDLFGIDLDQLVEVIPTVIRHSDQHITHRHFDFLYGSTGMCHFLLNFPQRPDVASHLQRFAQGIQSISETTANGRSLPLFYTQEDAPGRYLNAFSLAHGSCAVLIILAKIYQAGIAQSLCRALITESITFIMFHRNKGNSAQALYPGILDGKYFDSRLAWCYGDLNVAMALWHCGKALSEERWQTEALDIMLYNLHRNTPEAAGIVDNCLCHGSAGVAAFYRKFWFETNDRAFYQGAEHWHQVALDQLSFAPTPGIYGTKVWQGTEEEWMYAWDLLNGSCGVGLSLLSQLHEQLLAWDECLLLS